LGSPRMMRGEWRPGSETAGLLARSRASPRVFADFYDVMAPSILRYFAHQTRDPHSAFDLTAETFAKAFEKRDGFRGQTDEEGAAWLWAIARNELARFRRSRTIELAALNRLRLERPAPSDRELRRVEQLTATDEARRHIEQALTTLPPEQREVLELRFVEYLGYEAIAAQLGVSTDVARARTSRALRTLRESDHVHQAVHALEA
jgi:RNA polymerase sigma factor (sigma-70 family)